MADTEKGWRNPAQAGKRIVMGGPERTVDAEGFVVGQITMAEHNRFQRVAGWGFVMRNGSDVFAARLSDATKLRDRLKRDHEQARATENAIARQLADAEDRVASFTVSRQAATQVEQAEVARAMASDLRPEDMPYEALVAYARARGIKIPEATDRPTILLALRADPALKTEPQPNPAPSAPAAESKPEPRKDSSERTKKNTTIPPA